eukprot:2903450-Pleurochrysis_carterae.AAC.1
MWRGRRREGDGERGREGGLWGEGEREGDVKRESDCVSECVCVISRGGRACASAAPAASCICRALR